MRWAALGLLGLAGCLAPAPPAPPAIATPAAAELPPGYPPKIGTVTALLAGRAVAWETYDFSVGALDASAQFAGPKAAPEFRMLGMQPGQPNVERNRLTLKGSGPVKAGVLTDGLIEVVAGNNWDGLRLTSAGQTAAIVLDQVTADAGHSGHAKGHFSARLCAANGMPARVDARHCQDIAATFETDFQFDLH